LPVLTLMMPTVYLALAYRLRSSVPEGAYTCHAAAGSCGIGARGQMHSALHSHRPYPHESTNATVRGPHPADSRRCARAYGREHEVVADYLHDDYVYIYTDGWA
jgi:hypothetical protein